MKNSLKSFYRAMLAVVVMIGVSACGGDDDAAPSNQIKVDGQTFKFEAAHIESELNQEDELGQYSYHTFYLTGEGLTMSESGTLSGSGDLVVFGLVSTSTTQLVEGTYELGFNPAIGNVDYFELYSNLSMGGPETYYGTYRGTVKVSKSGDDRYTLTFKFDVVTSESASEDEEFVDGKLEGNYKGTVEVITGGAPTKLPSGRSAKGKKTFTWL